MAAPTRHDPYKNYPFRVEIDGLASSGFAEISGLSAEADVIEYREGADVTSMRKLPGLITYANVTLKCRLTTSRELFDWWMTVVNGNVVRRNVVIVLLDDDHKEVLRWILHQAWIAKIEVGDLNAKGTDVAIESIELAHEGLALAERRRSPCPNVDTAIGNDRRPEKVPSPSGRVTEVTPIRCRPSVRRTCRRTRLGPRP